MGSGKILQTQQIMILKFSVTVSQNAAAFSTGYFGAGASRVFRNSYVLHVQTCPLPNFLQNVAKPEH
eukprot:3383229-Rhodomonas_salina.2